jgi:RimJ/RimL family protein N-acetyltransferase
LLLRRTGARRWSIDGCRDARRRLWHGAEPHGTGQGSRFVAAILEFARERHDTQRFRLYILEWNERSRAVAARLGFAVESVLASDEGPFVVMVRNASGAVSRLRQDVSD